MLAYLKAFHMHVESSRFRELIKKDLSPRNFMSDTNTDLSTCPFAINRRCHNALMGNTPVVENP